MLTKTSNVRENKGPNYSPKLQQNSSENLFHELTLNSLFKENSLILIQFFFQQVLTFNGTL